MHTERVYTGPLKRQSAALSPALWGRGLVEGLYDEQRLRAIDRHLDRWGTRSVLSGAKKMRWQHCPPIRERGHIMRDGTATGFSMDVLLKPLCFRHGPQKIHIDRNN